MAHEIITKVQIDRALVTGLHQIEVSANAIITKVAKDYAEQTGITIVKTENPQVAAEQPKAEPSPTADQVRAAVVSKLGHTPEGLDAAISKVLGK